MDFAGYTELKWPSYNIFEQSDSCVLLAFISENISYSDLGKHLLWV
jgi:hypothetical protein